MSINPESGNESLKCLRRVREKGFGASGGTGGEERDAMASGAGRSCGYSARRALMGAMEAARLAGMAAAMTAQAESATAARPMAAGSQLDTP